jgi:hypothetical protein
MMYGNLREMQIILGLEIEIRRFSFNSQSPVLTVTEADLHCDSTFIFTAFYIFCKKAKSETKM